ncbi:hypothetical protein D3C72_1314320 [compost metagenome]
MHGLREVGAEVFRETKPGRASSGATGRSIATHPHPLRSAKPGCPYDPCPLPRCWNNAPIYGWSRSHQNVPRSRVPAQLLPRGPLAGHVQGDGQPLCGRARSAQRRAPAQPLDPLPEPHRRGRGAAGAQHRAGDDGREHAQRPAGARLAPARAPAHERAARAHRGLAFGRDRGVHQALPRRVREPEFHQPRHRPDRGRHRHPPDGRAHRRHEPDRAPAGALRHGGVRVARLLGAARHSAGARGHGTARRAELFADAHHAPAL